VLALAAMSDETRAVVNAWVDAFNARDVETILALYAEDIVTETPLLLKFGREAEPRLAGKRALRDYFTRALAAAGPIHFTPVHLAVDGEVALLEYNREAPHGGHPGVVERFVVRQGRIVETRVFWSADKIRGTFGLPR
jgi:ketosteroid isomerase-like protein